MLRKPPGFWGEFFMNRKEARESHELGISQLAREFRQFPKDTGPLAAIRRNCIDCLWLLNRGGGALRVESLPLMAIQVWHQPFLERWWTGGLRY